MKTRKMLLVMAAVFSMVALFTVSAHAAPPWYTCTIMQVGPGWGTTYMMMTDDGGAFTNKWFRPRSDAVKEMLATALTAKSNGEKVYIYTDLGGTYPVINAMYLGEPPSDS
jgi:hypothetical protein